MNVCRALRLSGLVLSCTLLFACASPDRVDPKYEPIEQMPVVEIQPQDNMGSIYQQSVAVNLFEDVKARRIGDIVTILLAEQTNAAKSADTNMDKSSETSIADPSIFGKTYDYGVDLSSGQEFSGQGKSNQSNRLSGSITVTVASVLPGGNLFVQGEKWIKINQGDEYIRVRGIIRPTDITRNNTVLSTQVADARISYGGTGTLAQANSAGWLTRFFMSPIWPF
jgi:flagellar L-ring protein precursor FlgH